MKKKSTRRGAGPRSPRADLSRHHRPGLVYDVVEVPAPVLGGARAPLPNGEGTKVQFRCSQAVRLAVLSRAAGEGLSEREAWERAGQEWANR